MLVQRFGSASNSSIRLHCLVLNDMYRRDNDGAPKFIEAPAPTAATLQTVLHNVITRTIEMHTRRKVVEAARSTALADGNGDSDETRTLMLLQAAAYIYCIAYGPRDGNLYAAVRCDSDDRLGLEQTCRYITHRALDDECTTLRRRSGAVEGQAPLARRHRFCPMRQLRRLACCKV